MSINKQSFREDASANRPPKQYKLNTDSSSIFTKQNDKDSPDQFIEKMESTISKKRKNNYKNIEELKNIYDKKSETNQYIDYSIEDKMDNFDITELSEAFDEMEKNVKNALRPFNSSSTDKKKSGKKKKKIQEDTIEGFSNKHIDNYEEIYKPEYEYDKGQTTNVGPKEYAEMANAARSGQLNTTELKVLLNTGKISQSQYNTLFGFILDSSGFNWKNTKPKPSDKGKCSKWNKNCGEDNGSNILDKIQELIDSSKDIVGFYSRKLRYVSTELYKSADGKLDGKPSNNSADVSIIVNILHYLIMIPLSILFAYNWFYIMFYRDEVDQPVKIDFSKNVMESLEGLLIRFFKCLVQPLILLDTFMRLVIPTIYFKIGNALKVLFIGKILVNPIFIFISITLLILYMTCAYSDKLLRMLLSYISDAKVPYDSYLYCIIAYDLIVGIAIAGLASRTFTIVEMILNPITSLFWFLVLLIFSFAMIRLGGLFCVLYLYAMSFLALIIYFPGHNPVDGINLINVALKAAVTSSDNKCPKGWWEKIILDILNLIYKYLFEVMYIIVLTYSVLLIFKDMKSSSGRIILGSTFSMILVIFIVIVYIRYLGDSKIMDKSEIDL